jgi:hypothetical protein
VLDGVTLHRYHELLGGHTDESTLMCFGINRQYAGVGTNIERYHSKTHQ